MTRDLSTGEDVELEWWYEPEEECQEATAPPRGAQAFAADDVSWAEDKQHPDYRHLDAGFAEEEFEFTGADLELIIRENRFEPTREEDRILFGLRGAMLATGGSASGPGLRLRLTRPDHREFRCVIGVYNTGTKLISGFVGSTVPWYAFVHDFFQRGRGDPRTNLLPTGCYPYYVGAHGKHQIPGCLRLGTGHDKAQQERVAVLRTIYDVRYDTTDIYDPSIPHANLHPSFSGRMFRSRGCQTVRGGFDAGHTGEWAEFRNAAGLGSRGDNGKRFDYVLVTGVEAAIASKLRRTGAVGNSGIVLERLTRLRHGSRGELVGSLQRKLGLQPTGLFGAQETRALTALQRKKLSFADGIYSPDMDARLEFGILKSAPSSAPVQVRHIAAGSKRIALVIGNGAYTAASQLTNPTHDAEAIADRLKSLDFSVTLLRDATEHSMVQSIVKFKDDLTACHVGLIFYAGHGVQIDGENYVLPVDCNPGTMPELRQSSVSLGTLLDPLEESGKVGIIILDCCRDNPFQGRSLSRSLRRGFANLGAPAGTFIAFSTQPGATASDGTAGQHSPFAHSLLQHIIAEDQDVGQMMRVVRKEVNEKTEGRQLPWDQSSLMVDHFAFKQSNRSAEHRVLTREELDRQRKETAREREEEYWTLTSSSNSEQLLESFISQYPDSRFRGAADTKLKEIRDAREKERMRALRVKWWSRAATAAAVILCGVVFGLWNVVTLVRDQNNLLNEWRDGAFTGQFKLLLAKARDKLEAGSSDDARALALAARRIFKERNRAVDFEYEYDDKKPGKAMDPVLGVDFANVVVELMRRQADVELAGSIATNSVKAAFTPDGRYIVWAEDGQDKGLILSDANTGSLVRRQPRYADNVRTLITSPDGSHAALLSERGDAELFSLRRNSDYYDVYAEDDVRAIAFGTVGSRLMLAAVNKNGDVLGWRFDAQGALEGKAIRLPRAAGRPSWNNAMGTGFAISCYESLCVWAEPDGAAFAARLGTEVGSGWQRLQGTSKLDRWPGPTPPLLRLAKERIITHAAGGMSLYALGTQDGTFSLKALHTWNDPAITSIDVDEQQRLTLRYPPDDKNKSWTVQHSEIKLRDGRYELEHIYYRDYDRQTLDFNSPTNGVIFAATNPQGRSVLKRRVDQVLHKERDCVHACDLIRWLGANGRVVYGVDHGDLMEVELGDADSTSRAVAKIERQITDWFTRRGQQPRTPAVDFVTQALDPARRQLLVLAVVPELETEPGNLRSAAFVAAIDLKTGLLKGDPVRVNAPDPEESVPYADLVLAGTSRPERRDAGTRATMSVSLRVLVRVAMDGAVYAVHDPNREQWQEARTGGKAGWLYRIESENMIRIAYFHDDPSYARNKRPDIRIAPDKGRLSAFGFLDEGSSAFLAYEEGHVEIWSLDLTSKAPQPITINTRTKLNSAQDLAWAIGDRVLHVHDESSIRSYNRLGLLLNWYAPGGSSKRIGGLQPLATGELFAVVGLKHIVMPAVTLEADVDKIPYMAEALTPRWLSRSDSDVHANWFLPADGTVVPDTPAAACAGDPNSNYQRECSRLLLEFSTPGQRALALSEHAYRSLERQLPSRAIAFALTDAAAGNPLALALIARELGESEKRSSPAQGGDSGTIRCDGARASAMLALYTQAMRRGRFVAPALVGLALQCTSIAARVAKLTDELTELSEAGDPMAFALLGYELERSAMGSTERLDSALQNYVVANRLLLAQRDRRQPQKLVQGQDAIEAIEVAIHARRVQLAARLALPDLVKVFENADNSARRVLAAIERSQAGKGRRRAQGLHAAPDRRRPRRHGGSLVGHRQGRAPRRRADRQEGLRQLGNAGGAWPLRAGAQGHRHGRHPARQPARGLRPVSGRGPAAADRRLCQGGGRPQRAPGREEARGGAADSQAAGARRSLRLAARNRQAEAVCDQAGRALPAALAGRGVRLKSRWPGGSPSPRWRRARTWCETPRTRAFSTRHRRGCCSCSTRGAAPMTASSRWSIGGM